MSNKQDFQQPSTSIWTDSKRKKTSGSEGLLDHHSVVDGPEELTLPDVSTLINDNPVGASNRVQQGQPLAPEAKASTQPGQFVDSPQTQTTEDLQDQPVDIAQAQALAVFGPVGLGIAVGVTGVTVSVWWYYEGGGRELIGTVTDAIGRGVTGTIDEIGRILGEAGRGGLEQLDRIEDYISDRIFRSESEPESEGLSEILDEILPGSTVDDLSNSGRESDPGDRGGELTRAGRALQKHGDRPDSAFPAPRGNPEALNQQGQNALDEIVYDPDATVEKGNRFGGFDVKAPDGRGARFDGSGTFRGFLEP